MNRIQGERRGRGGKGAKEKEGEGKEEGARERKGEGLRAGLLEEEMTILDGKYTSPRWKERRPLREQWHSVPELSLLRLNFKLKIKLKIKNFSFFWTLLSRILHKVVKTWLLHFRHFRVPTNHLIFSFLKVDPI